MKYIAIVLSAFLSFSCSSDDSQVISPPLAELYFPPINSTVWETQSLQELNWDEAAADDLLDFLSQGDTRGFILLKDGKIVIEEYWGNNLADSAPFDLNANWYWASAGKTLTAFLVGMAQQQGLMDIENKSSDYLGPNWSSLTQEKQDLITVRHHLTMTTGLDYSVSNVDCTTPDCLTYKEDAGEQWYYHNAPYTLLGQMISNTSNMTYNEFTDVNIEPAIGMEGSWVALGDNNVFFSTPRSAARFGLLMLNEGNWDGTDVMTDKDYFSSITNSSQSLNPSYGFLTWLNGKSSIILPGLPFSFNIPLAADAPADLYAAVGKNGQYIDVVPSENLVVIRMGDSPDNALVPVAFHNDMWEKLNAVIN